MKRRTPAALFLSALALATGLVVHEGYRGQAYDDGGGVQTLGFGSTTHADGTPVKAGDTTTPVRALVRLAKHVDQTEKAMRACIGPVPLYQHEWDAYVELAYNIGSGAFCGSTLVKLLHKKPPDYAGACAQILRWNKDNGQVIPGLVTRRQDEYRLCMGIQR